MLYTVHGLDDPYLSNTLDVLLYDESAVTKLLFQSKCSNF